MTFDPSLPCRTRSGRRVEILAVLPPDKMPSDGQNIVALVHGHADEDGFRVETYRADGHFLGMQRSTMDLVNVPVPVVSVEEYEEMTARERLGRSRLAINGKLRP